MASGPLVEGAGNEWACSGIRQKESQKVSGFIEMLNIKAMHRSHLVKREAIEQKACSLMSRK